MEVSAFLLGEREMSGVEVRVGSLDEVTQVVETIGEFARKETVESLSERLNDKHDALVLVAVEDRQLLGFKIGYRLDDTTYYSWLGGVSPLARGKGVAQKLLDYQEAWVADKGYRELNVKSRNQFPSMLRLLIRNHYQIEDFERVDPLQESRIHFTKLLIA
jgi:GNAT superfamily N-acetyltransferase